MKDEKEPELHSQLYTFVTRQSIHARKWAVITQRSSSIASSADSTTKGTGDVGLLERSHEVIPEITFSGETSEQGESSTSAELEEPTPDRRAQSQNGRDHSSDDGSVHGPSTCPENSDNDLITSDSPEIGRSSLLSPASSSGSLSISLNHRRKSLGEDLAQATTFLAGLTGMDILTDDDLNGNHVEGSSSIPKPVVPGFKRRDTRRLAGPSGEVLHKKTFHSILDMGTPSEARRGFVEGVLLNGPGQADTGSRVLTPATQSTLVAPPQLSSTLLSSDRELCDSDSSDNTVADLLGETHGVSHDEALGANISFHQGPDHHPNGFFSDSEEEDEVSSQNDHMNSILAPIQTQHVRATTVRREEPDFEELERYFPTHQMSLFVGTWNMHSEKEVPILVDDFLMPAECELLQDMYVIGTQECSPHRREWEVAVQATLGPTHVLVRSESLGDIHLMILVRREMIWIMRDVQSCTVACGAGGVMRNKGAVAIVLTVFGTSILFVTAHLRAHASKVKERNYETERIASSLDFSRYPKERQHNDIFDKVDCAFWFGDLNYRNTCDRQTAEDSICRDDLRPLLECDQLTQQVREKQTLTGFSEAPISFPPTFKFDPGTCNYDTSTKQRVPSWTDRILFRSSEDAITNKSYHYCPSLMSSDHRPVFCVYLVTLKPSPISQTIRAASGWFDKRAYAQGMKRRQYVQRTRSSSNKEHHMKQPSLIMKAVNGPAKVMAGHKRSMVCSVM